MAYPRSWKHRLRIAAAARAAAIVSNSAEGEAYWAAQRTVTVPRFVISNAQPHEEIGATVAADLGTIGGPPAAPLILFLGRFSEEKNVMVILRSIERARHRAGPHVRRAPERPARFPARAPASSSRRAPGLSCRPAIRRPWRVRYA
jgi:glycosyltransferase involved in cell wall biosynthesis